MLDNEGKTLRRVVVSRPRREYFGVAEADVERHHLNEVADRDRTLEQHGLLASAMASFGAEVIDVPELSGHPNSVFTRDVSVVTPEGFIELRMGLPTRRGEEAWMARELLARDEPRAGVIEPPGTVEGGDVLLAGKVAFVGQSTRTNPDGVAQVTELLKRMGYQVRVAEVSEALHLGGVMSAIAPDRMLVCRGSVPEDFCRGFDVIEVEKRGPSTGNVICIAPNEIIGNDAENVECLAELDARGVQVHNISLSEFRKGAGGPTCLILPLERAGA